MGFFSYIISTQQNPKQSGSNRPATTDRRFRNSKIIEASQAAIITELICFSDTNNVQAATQMQIEQPCFKLKVVVYEALELINTLSRSKHVFSSSLRFGGGGGIGSGGQSAIQSQLLNRHFESITVNLNQSLSCELDISVIDRLYYLINDISKYTGSSSAGGETKGSSSCVGEEGDDQCKKFQNFEIKCSQVIKLALRFPIADLRRAQSKVSY